DHELGAAPLEVRLDQIERDGERAVVAREGVLELREPARRDRARIERCHGSGGRQRRRADRREPDEEQVDAELHAVALGSTSRAVESSRPSYQAPVMSSAPDMRQVRAALFLSITLGVVGVWGVTSSLGELSMQSTRPS